MPMSNFPYGFPQGLSLRGLPIIQTHPGKVFWLYNGSVIDSQSTGGSDGNPGTFQRPVATLAGALNRCTAGRGDIILIKPGHSETISSATACLVNVADVAIVGLGVGTNRPLFTIDTANTATLPVSVNNVSFQNCAFKANFLSIAACFTLTTAKEFTVQNCYFSDSAANKNFLNIVKSTGAANTVDGLCFCDNQVTLIGTTWNTTVLTANDIDRFIIQRNYLKGPVGNDKAIAAIVTAGVLTNLLATDNVCYRPNTTTAGGSFINVGGTTSTGIVRNNFVQTLTTTSDLLITTTVGLGFQGNSVSGAVGAQGFPIPALDS